MKRLLTITLMLAAIVTAQGRRVRTGPSRTPKTSVATLVSTLPDTIATPIITADTINEPPAPGSVRLSGYDKTLRARRETFHATNALLDSATIIELWITLDYADMDGRQFHRADHRVRCHIPFGQTRMLTVPTFDRQSTFYYHQSPRPRTSA
ncbi:MAG: hypothetical protein K2M97_01220, partial [Muribaculaceae bacterium]|nr:hypothetical protein [Muribaculaceae bacterium]